jgi:hypothetical protein
MHKSGWWLAGLALCLVGTTASAQSCGTVVGSSVTVNVTHDMNCAGFPFAFKVAAHGVTINLNGFRIHSYTGDDAIVIRDVGNLTIRGPGKIEGFYNAVNALRSDNLTVTNVELINAGETGIKLVNSRYASLQNNRFRGFMELAAIDVRQPLGVAGVGAGNHTIANNTFDSVFYGISVCGADAGANRISGNSFANIIEIALSLSHEADGNTIEYNKFRWGAYVSFVSSNRNAFQWNVFENTGGWGLGVGGAAPSACVTRIGAPKSVGNRILNNKSYGTFYPFVLGNGAYDNRIGSNRIQGATIGLWFGTGSLHNDGRGNTFTGTTTPVVDDGVGNVY